MKRLRLAATTFALIAIAASQGSAQRGDLLRVYTVVALNALTLSANARAAYLVRDGSSTSDCTAGGGSFVVLCGWNGDSWLPFAGIAGPTTDALLMETGDYVLMETGDKILLEN